MLILTCKLGNEIINCYDGTHNKEQLKKWASKKILLCPVCGKPYEYCHGKVKTPYFRHADKAECEYFYSEPETEEHLNGKRDLYEWIKGQDGVTNAVLEGWIPETKQRPDIMFEYKNKTYVIEYQCSPIATEYIERHDLYKSLGIIDIWVLGTDKYLQKNMRDKYLEGICFGYYNPETQQFIYPLDSDTHSSLNMFSFKFGFNSNYYKPTDKRIGTRLYSKYLKDLHFNGHIIDDIVPDKKVVKEKRKIRNAYHDWKCNISKNEISNKLDKFCTISSNDVFNFSYDEHGINCITLKCESRYKGYCVSYYKHFYSYYTTNVILELNNNIIKIRNNYNKFIQKIPILQPKYFKLFYMLRNQKIIIIKSKDRKMAFKKGIQYKRIKNSDHTGDWEYIGNFNFNNDADYFSSLENEFIVNLYDALKFLKTYSFDYVISVPEEIIAGDSGMYNLSENTDIEIYFTKVLGFRNIEIYK